VRDELVRWAGSLGLEATLARLLPKGDIFDGLSGVKDLNDVGDDEREAYIADASARLARAIPGLLRAGIRKLKTAAPAGSEVREHLNSKFSFDGAFEGKFATLDEFHRGPEALIGVPNPKIMEGMRQEHCSRANATTEFRSPNYNLVTRPDLEWRFVTAPSEDDDYPHTPKDKARWKAGNDWKGEEGRDMVALEKFLEMDEVKRAGLTPEEVIALRLYTGPMFSCYNAALRGFPAADVAKLQGNKYETTIFAIASGITKLSKISAIPPGRRLFRRASHPSRSSEATLSATLLWLQPVVETLRSPSWHPCAPPRVA
jgi:hypothetical protein